MTNTKVLPLGLLYHEPADQSRGYDTYPETWNYDPKTQVTDLILMGKTSPTTYSKIASTHFIVKPSDKDEGADDKGTD